MLTCSVRVLPSLKRPGTLNVREHSSRYDVKRNKAQPIPGRPARNHERITLRQIRRRSDADKPPSQNRPIANGSNDSIFGAGLETKKKKQTRQNIGARTEE